MPKHKKIPIEITTATGRIINSDAMQTHMRYNVLTRTSDDLGGFRLIAIAESANASVISSAPIPENETVSIIEVAEEDVDELERMLDESEVVNSYRESPNLD